MSLHDYDRIKDRLKSVADPVGFLTNLFAHSPVAFGVWSADGTALLTNQAFMDIFQSEPPPDYNVLKDDILAKNGMLPLFQKAFSGETVQVPTFWYDPRDLNGVNVTEGRRVAISMTIFPLFKPNGEIDYVAATYKDQTEIMEAMEQLRISNERFGRLTESGIIGIVLSDTRGNIHEVNDAFLAIVGYSREDMRAGLLHARTLNTPERDLTDAAALAQLTREGIASPWEKELMRKDGSRVPVLSGAAMLNETERVAFVLDLTKLKRAEAKAAEAESLRRAKEATDEANAELEAFSYSVAHDLRAPLRGLSGFSSILLEDYREKLDAKGQDYLARIDASAGRMSHIIDALLALARLTRTEIRHEQVDLTQLAERIIGQLQAANPERMVEFLVQPDLIATGDPELLQALLDNLLSNAWKFTAQRTPGRIEFGRDPLAAETFMIRDNGAGFDMNHVGKLFAPFRRLHTNEQFEGTGIGLAIVQRIVRRHGGRVWAEATENEGATFRFTLFHDGIPGY